MFPSPGDLPNPRIKSRSPTAGKFFTVWATREAYAAAAAAAKSLQSCPTLCDPIDSSPLGSPVPGILQAKTMEWVAISFSNAWKWKVKSESEVTQSCQTVCDPMDCSLPGSSTHGIFQARVLEWGTIAFSQRSLYITIIPYNFISWFFLRIRSVSLTEYTYFML